MPGVFDFCPVEAPVNGHGRVQSTSSRSNEVENVLLLVERTAVRCRNKYAKDVAISSR